MKARWKHAAAAILHTMPKISKFKANTKDKSVSKLKNKIEYKIKIKITMHAKSSSAELDNPEIKNQKPT